jgi:hypothetical protein
MMTVTGCLAHGLEGRDMLLVAPGADPTECDAVATEPVLARRAEFQPGVHPRVVRTGLSRRLRASLSDRERPEQALMTGWASIACLAAAMAARGMAEPALQGGLLTRVLFARAHACLVPRRSAVSPCPGQDPQLILVSGPWGHLASVLHGFSG